MTIDTINASENHSQHVAQVYQEQYARLRHYFLVQLGDGSEVEDCIQETLRRFFFFMEDRDWETEAEYLSVYIMRIAGLLCSRRLREQRTNCTPHCGNKSNYLLNKIRAEAHRTIKERIEFMKIFLGLHANGGTHPSGI